MAGILSAELKGVNRFIAARTMVSEWRRGIIADSCRLRAEEESQLPNKIVRLLKRAT